MKIHVNTWIHNVLMLDIIFADVAIQFGVWERKIEVLNRRDTITVDKPKAPNLGKMAFLNILIITFASLVGQPMPSIHFDI